MREWLKEAPICAILRNVPQEVLREYAEAIFRGGIRMFEIAMNSENGAEQIESLKRQFENRPEVKIGAGTVTTMARCQEAELAGADFFLNSSASGSDDSVRCGDLLGIWLFSDEVVSSW